jgi:hypothetical protein
MALVLITRAGIAAVGVALAASPHAGHRSQPAAAKGR